MKFLIMTLASLLIAHPGFALQATEPVNNIDINGDGSPLESVYNYNFGSVRQGRSTSAQFTLTNTGRLPVYVNSVNVNGPGFSSSANCPRLLLPRQRCGARVRFSPSRVGNYSGRLQFNLTGGQDTTVYLRGRGVR